VRIHFSNVNFSSRTGPNTFAGRLAHELTLRGHEIVPAGHDCEIFLAFIEPATLPPSGVKVVQRLDGIWFKPDQFESHNQGIKWLYDRADHVIWQSEFDRKMTTHWWGERVGSVIGNGIHLETGEPYRKEHPLDGDPLLVCAANWHPQKRLRECIRLAAKIQETHPAAKLVILGKMGDNLGLNDLTDAERQMITYIGDREHDQCLRIYGTADWFIHLAWLDHCPNVVVEALSQGCPVICAGSGGTPELVGRNGVVIPEMSSYNFELTDYDNPPTLNFSNFRLPERPLVQVEDYDIRVIASRYLSLFSKLCEGQSNA
jgi:glycosyltransferase involved in cell wall biosynthesis